MEDEFAPTASDRFPLRAGAIGEVQPRLDTVSGKFSATAERLMVCISEVTDFANRVGGRQPESADCGAESLARPEGSLSTLEECADNMSDMVSNLQAQIERLNSIG